MAAVTDVIKFAENAAAGTYGPFEWRGGYMCFSVRATFGGGSAKLQILDPGGVAVDFPSSTLSAAGAVILNVPAGQVQAVGATGSAFFVYGTPVKTRTRG